MSVRRQLRLSAVALAAGVLALGVSVGAPIEAAPATQPQENSLIIGPTGTTTAADGTVYVSAVVRLANGAPFDLSSVRLGDTTIATDALWSSSASTAVVLVVDRSEAAGGGSLPELTNAIVQSVANQLRPHLDRFAVLAAARGVTPVHEFAGFPSRIRQRRLRLEFGGPRCTWTAGLAGIDYAARSPLPARAVVLITGGPPQQTGECRVHSADELVAASRAANAPVSVVLLSPGPPGAADQLQMLAERTRGAYWTLGAQEHVSTVAQAVTERISSSRRIWFNTQATAGEMALAVVANSGTERLAGSSRLDVLAPPTLVDTPVEPPPSMSATKSRQPGQTLAWLAWAGAATVGLMLLRRRRARRRALIPALAARSARPSTALAGPTQRAALGQRVRQLGTAAAGLLRECVTGPPARARRLLPAGLRVPIGRAARGSTSPAAQTDPQPGQVPSTIPPAREHQPADLRERDTSPLSPEDAGPADRHDHDTAKLAAELGASTAELDAARSARDDATVMIDQDTVAWAALEEAPASAAHAASDSGLFRRLAYALGLAGRTREVVDAEGEGEGEAEGQGHLGALVRQETEPRTQQDAGPQTGRETADDVSAVDLAAPLRGAADWRPADTATLETAPLRANSVVTPGRDDVAGAAAADTPTGDQPPIDTPPPDAESMAPRRGLLAGLATLCSKLGRSWDAGSSSAESSDDDNFDEWDGAVGFHESELMRLSAAQPAAKSAAKLEELKPAPFALVGTAWNKYRIEAPLGRGGLGEVYRAHDLVLDRTVALKVLVGSSFESSEVVDRLRREAGLAAQLQHPNVVVVYEVASYRGQVAIVMEYVEGRNLADVIEEKGRLEDTELVPILDDIAAALDAIHARGVAHGDVKPSNVLIGTDGRIRLCDFGIARRLGHDPNAPRAGTPYYVAPEILEGGDVEARSDVYSLGALGVAALTGRAGAIGEVPAPYATVFRSALEPDPQVRCDRAGILAAAYRTAVENEQLKRRGPLARLRDGLRDRLAAKSAPRIEIPESAFAPLRDDRLPVVFEDPDYTRPLRGITKPLDSGHDPDGHTRSWQ